MLEIVCATANENKIKEINEVALDFGVEFVLPSTALNGNFNPIEDGKTFEENAAIKAVYASKVETKGHKLFLSDDSGLCVDSMGGEPGIGSARYAPTNDERIEKVLKNLEGVKNRDAQFVCAMVLCDKESKILHTTKGICKGVIAQSSSGEGGFGYDPIFIPSGQNLTMAGIPSDEKNKISHRGKALRDMLIWIKLSELTKDC